MNGAAGGFVRRALLVGILALLLVALPPARADEDPVEPTLRVSFDRDLARTNDRVVVTVTGTAIALNETTGNATLVPSDHLVNLTLTDTNSNTVVWRESGTLFNGSASWVLFIKPEFSSTRLRVFVEDLRTREVAEAFLLTEYSDNHFLYIIEYRGWVRYVTFVEDQDRRTESERTWERALVSALAVLMIALVVVLFLRRDHTILRALFAPSLWDRFAARYLNYTLVSDEWWAWLADKETWDSKTARKFTLRRARSSLRALSRLRDRIDEELRSATPAEEVV